MNKKYKLLILLIVLIILIIVLKQILNFNSITYKLNIDNNKINIKETYKDNYYIELTFNKKVYPFRIYKNLNKNKIVKNAFIYKDDSVECVLPVIDNSLYTDMMCFKDGILYDYNSIKGEFSDLDKYVENIDLYNSNNFNNTILDTKTVGTVKYNIFDNFDKTTAITTYNGLLVNGESVKLFEKDIYNNKLNAFINGYYITADYESNFTFKYFYIVNLNTKEIKRLESKIDISYDSYIEDIVDDKLYIYDKDNENQYEIDIENNKIKLISSDKYIKYYNNKKWEKMNKAKANNEIYFNYETLDNYFTDYDLVKESDEYYYLFKKDGISYKLYRVDKNNIDVYKYLLDVPTTDIKFNDNYLYYIYKNKLYYYSDSALIKTILENSELEFNDTIKYYID